MINTNFRRVDIISKMRYKVLASVAELPSFTGCEQIRQTIGVHDRSGLANKLRGTEDALKQ